LTHLEDLGSRQSLDYIFECFYDENFDEINNPNRKLILNKQKLSVEKFFVKNILLDNYYDNYKRPYTQLSDHYGLCCNLNYKGTLFMFFN